jgi:monoamine oxidase
MTDVEVIVVGLGISGLTALRSLTGQGIRCLGIDARPRTGGRTARITLPSGFAFEAGGEFLKPAHTRIRALMAELGVPALPLEPRGATVSIHDGERTVGVLPFADRPDAHAEYVAARTKFDELVATITVGRVHESPDAEQLDSLSVAEWVSTVVTDDSVRRRLSRELVSGLGGPGGDLSLLVALGYAAAAVPGADAHPDERVDGGGFAIAEALAADIPSDLMLLGSPVTRIEQTDDGVTVSTSSTTIRANAVIVAMSPKLAREVTFDPPLPPSRRALFDGWTQAYGTKTFIVYPTPWWRESGLSGFGSGDAVVRSLGDLSPADGSLGVLLAETHPTPGDHTDPSPAEYRAAVLDAVESYLGVAPEEPLDFGFHFWPSDPLAGGCGSPLPPGLITAYGDRLDRPVGRIHFAGTETSDLGWGSMEGAVRAGERASSDVIIALESVEKEK